MISIKSLTLPKTAGLVAFSSVSFILLLAGYGSLMLGKPADAHILVVVFAVFGASAAGLVTQRLMVRSSANVLVLQTSLTLMTFGALPWLYSYSSRTLLVEISIVVLSICAFSILGAELCILVRRAPVQHREASLLAAAFGGACAMFCVPFALYFNPGFFRLGAGVSFLNAACLLAFVLLLAPKTGALRVIWYALGIAMWTTAATYLLVAEKMQTLIEQTQLAIR